MQGLVCFCLGTLSLNCCTSLNVVILISYAYLVNVAIDNA